MSHVLPSLLRAALLSSQTLETVATCIDGMQAMSATDENICFGGMNVYMTWAKLTAQLCLAVLKAMFDWIWCITKCHGTTRPNLDT